MLAGTDVGCHLCRKIQPVVIKSQRYSMAAVWWISVKHGECFAVGAGLTPERCPACWNIISGGPAFFCSRV